MIARRPAPVRLRAGEALLWEGVPDWLSLAVRALHVRVVVLYFAALQADSIATVIAKHMSLADAVRTQAQLFLLGSAVVAFWLAMAWLMARTTRYSITSERVVMRFGLALPATLAMPLGAIHEVGVRINRDGRGDLALRLRPGQQVSFVKLWPHARPWRLSAPQPMLRSVADAGTAGAMLSRLLAAATVRPAEPERELAAAD